jgi:three-Cys-motif partner protein
MKTSDHKFGGQQTRVKLEALENYLPAFTTALSKQPFRLNFIDAFAGTGTCRITVDGREEVIPGSASIAIDCRPTFHRIFFIEAKLRRAQALRKLIAASGYSGAEIIHGDANVELPKVLDRMSRRTDRAVVFLDPYGMAVDWETVKRCAASGLADIIYLFPLSGLYRQAANDSRAIDPDKARRLDRMLGTTAWREAFYVGAPQSDFFSDEAYDVRSADVNQMTSWVTGHLKTVFAGVVGPKILYQARAGGKEGAPLFALYFAVSNPSAKAVGLATRIARTVFQQAAAAG